MSVRGQYDFRVYISIHNLKTQNKELDFGDFKIISVEQGPEAAKWKRKLACKVVPRNVLIKEFPNHKMKDNESTGFDRIMDSIKDLLFIFRLFRVGDILFSDLLIKDIKRKESFCDPYSSAKHSLFKYSLRGDDIEKFNIFRNEITSKAGYGNKYYEFSSNHFMSGINKDFFYRIENFERIVDYVVALESLFLIDNKLYFLRRTIAERISRLLEDDCVKRTVKYMYDERSNIVHGNNIGLSEKQRKTKIEKIKAHMPRLESLMREVFLKLLDFNFSKKEEIIAFMRGLYNVPSESLRIMQSAKEKAEKYLWNR